jgi:tripartite-type tricarboxylate transporter receptor subunit TctC
MLDTRFLAIALAIAPGISLAQAPNYPTKPIRIVTSGPGASMDLVARVTAEGLTGTLGQAVVVENRDGAGGIIAGDLVAKAAPDGYTLLTYTTAMVILPFLRKNVPFDPVTDLSPITLATSSPNVIVVHPSVPVNSLQELITLAKGKPRTLNYSSAGTGSSTHLSAELFKSMAGIDMVHILYKSTAPALNDLISGQVQVSVPSASTVMPHVKAGRLKALAVTSARVSPLAAGLPTVATSGVPGYESELLVGLWAPGKTPPALINRLNTEIVKVLNQPASKGRLLTGAEIVASSPEQFAQVIERERARLGKVIKEANISAE